MSNPLHLQVGQCGIKLEDCYETQHVAFTLEQEQARATLTPVDLIRICLRSHAYDMVESCRYCRKGCHIDDKWYDWDEIMPAWDDPEPQPDNSHSATTQR